MDVQVARESMTGLVRQAWRHPIVQRARFLFFVLVGVVVFFHGLVALSALVYSLFYYLYVPVAVHSVRLPASRPARIVGTPARLPRHGLSLPACALRLLICRKAIEARCARVTVRRADAVAL